MGECLRLGTKGNVQNTNSKIAKAYLLFIFVHQNKVNNNNYPMIKVQEQGKYKIRKHTCFTVSALFISFLLSVIFIIFWYLIITSSNQLKNISYSNCSPTMLLRYLQRIEIVGKVCFIVSCVLAFLLILSDILIFISTFRTLKPNFWKFIIPLMFFILLLQAALCGNVIKLLFALQSLQQTCLSQSQNEIKANYQLDLLLLFLLMFIILIFTNIVAALIFYYQITQNPNSEKYLERQKSGHFQESSLHVKDEQNESSEYLKEVFQGVEVTKIEKQDKPKLWYDANKSNQNFNFVMGKFTST